MRMRKSRDDRPRDDDRGYANGGGYEDRGGGGGGGKSRGTALRWNERGFGFIKPDDGGDDLFCHVRELVEGEGSVREGDEVEYRVTFDDRRGAPSEGGSGAGIAAGSAWQ